MQDDVYYRRRAERQLSLAQQATDPSVCSAHYRLANLYLERVTRNGGSADPAKR